MTKKIEKCMARSVFLFLYFLILTFHNYVLSSPSVIPMPKPSNVILYLEKVFPFCGKFLHLILFCLYLILHTLYSVVHKPSYLAKVILTKMDLIPEMGLI